MARFLLISIFLAIAPFNAVCAAQEAIKVEIREGEDGFHLFRGGELFEIKGAGLENGDIALLAEHGGNAIRNWSTANAKEVLDFAHQNSVVVALGLPVTPERWGFDYDDPEAVTAQLETVRQEVLKYRDHPALLGWIIGNELNFDYTNPRVYDAVNDISKMIHALDPNHPTTTTVAGLGLNVVKDLKERAPDLDILSFQVYGELANLPEFLQEAELERPVWITEWGAIGHWEMPKTLWQAPIEMNSSEKARVYERGFTEFIEPYQGQVIGSFAFLWGQKQERTATWFGMFTEQGHETETVDVMHKIWNGQWPANRSPALMSLTMDSETAQESVSLSPGEFVDVEVLVSDPDGDNLDLRWELKPESTADQVGGDREEIIDNLALNIQPSSLSQWRFQAPETTGAYRLLLYAYDGYNHAAHANIPFLVRE